MYWISHLQRTLRRSFTLKAPSSYYEAIMCVIQRYPHSDLFFGLGLGPKGLNFVVIDFFLNLVILSQTFFNHSYMIVQISKSLAVRSYPIKLKNVLSRWKNLKGQTWILSIPERIRDGGGMFAASVGYPFMVLP